MSSTPPPYVGGLHTPRLDARQEALDTTFSQIKMAAAWKDYVRPGLRNQEVLDLFDYNDFHWNRTARFSDLQRAIMAGRYQPSNSIPTKLEKSQGVCRTIVTPSPEDALVLQCVVELILPLAIKKQPSQNAFFSRSHKSFAGSFTFGRDYIWFKQWPKFFKRRIAVASSHDWIATTDVSTFFDNVHYNHLRNMLSSLGEIEEVVLDVLFLVLNGIAWRPDYLPSNNIGLPQVQFDAPRLLAHVYLFEIDNYLRKQAGNHFVRWVDDITFAVDTKQEAKRLLRDLDILLQMRGVRLNSGKTRVLSAAEARQYFHQLKNEYLDRLRDRIAKKRKAGLSLKPEKASIKASFKSFVTKRAYGHSDKVIKRYLGLFAELNDPAAIPFCIKQLEDEPGLRDTIYRYFLKIGPTDSILRAISAYVTGPGLVDDASLCQLGKVLTDFEITPKARAYNRVRGLIAVTSKVEFINGDPYKFIFSLWLIAKYSTETRIFKFLKDFEDVWKHSEFLSRQVAACAAKLRKASNYVWLTGKIERHSFRSPLSVLTSIEHTRSFTTSVPSDIRLYILNGNSKGTYSLQRFLVTCSVLGSAKLASAEKAKLKSSLMTILKDPHYRRIVIAI